MVRDEVKKDISKLNLNSETVIKLKSNLISTIDDLWKKSRIDLKKMGLKDSEVNQIIINLQLIGLDLNRKKY